ncbi:SURF1 family protein [Microbacterium sp. AZCO]|uniref:SURF1 family cytochrome oxidase biogenesis protein n=1 Tax=Microbacterium sp. AZCO TaxID=3142976 RepID=UPI0031F37D6A
MSRRQEAPAALRWTVYVAVAIVFAIACAFLSHWQFSRNADRSEQLSLVAQNYNAEPVPLDELIPAGGTLDPGDEWRPVELTGSYLADDQLLVRNRVHEGTAAYEVLVPFRLHDGRVLLVDRGWVPPGDEQNLPDVVPAAPSGQVTVVARLRAGESLPASGRSAPEGQVPSIHLPTVADAIDPAAGDALELSAYGAMVSEDPAPATQPQPLEAPSDDPGPYLSYAVQWILFAIMGFGFIWYVIRTERQHKREDEEDAAALAAGETPPVRDRTKRRRDRDADDEDALLDSTRS